MQDRQKRQAVLVAKGLLQDPSDLCHTALWIPFLGHSSWVQVWLRPSPSLCQLLVAAPVPFPVDVSLGEASHWLHNIQQIWQETSSVVHEPVYTLNSFHIHWNRHFGYHIHLLGVSLQTNICDHIAKKRWRCSEFHLKSAEANFPFPTAAQECKQVAVVVCMGDFLHVPSSIGDNLIMYILHNSRIISVSINSFFWNISLDTFRPNCRCNLRYLPDSEANVVHSL